MSNYLAHIDGPEDLHRLTPDQLPDLASEIRAMLIDYCRVHGGHAGSNLGVVEATIAVHYVFDSPKDHVIFDVSHQSYTHKILTGRRRSFADPDRYGSVTGFTNPAESEHDSFVLGHTGTSVSLACGMAKARDMTGGDGHVIAVIGDGALSSAIAFEGLNEAAELHSNLIIIVNDNEMSIAENHGGMYEGLARLRDTHGGDEPNLFRALGLDYRYVERGNDPVALVDALREIKDMDHAVVLHIHTRKGLGLDAALEGRVEANHWQDACGKADAPLNARKTYGAMAMDALAKRFDDEPGLLVISPATPGSNGITRQWRQHAGRHYIDTGITEEHAVAFAAGVGRAGGTPVLATSATFFQRAYDQIHQELALNGSPATLLVFSGGISGTDNTHSGAGDIVMLGNVPGLTYLAPTTGREFLDMLAWSTGAARRPVAIRVPGDDILAAERLGGYPMFPVAESGRRDDWERYAISRQGNDVALLGLGNAYPLAERTARLLIGKGLSPTVIDPRQCSTLDAATLDALIGEHRLVVTMEDGQLDGGWGQKIAAYYGDSPMRVITVGADKEVTDLVPMSRLRHRYGLTPEQIADHVLADLAI